MELLTSPETRLRPLGAASLHQIEADLRAAGKRKARAAYLAIALDLAPKFQMDQPERWKEAVADLRNGYPEVVESLFDAKGPLAEKERRNRDGLNETLNRWS